jgi:flagellar hook protein FlgE
MNTAISGLSAQSSAFGNISDNVANSQTVGYKRVDTAFIDYLTTSTASVNIPGAVVARPDYVNNVEGTITQTDNTLGLAVTGQGFFAVSKQAGTVNSLPAFETQQEYTRAGDFQMDKNGYLVNSAGLFLNGWQVDLATGVVNQNTLTPIRVSQTVFNPIATGNVSISANLPATPAPGTATTGNPIQSDIDVYDAMGTAHTVTLKSQLLAANAAAVPPIGANTWQVDISPKDGSPCGLDEDLVWYGRFGRCARGHHRYGEQLDIEQHHRLGKLRRRRAGDLAVQSRLRPGRTADHVERRDLRPI